MGFLSQRRREVEQMDDAGVSREELHRALKFIGRVNRFLGYTRGIIHHLDRFSRRWQPGQRITLLDVGTGDAQIPRAILRWANRRRFDLRITAIDRHPLTLQIAAELPPDHRLQLVQADALELPFDAGSFDYVISAMFLHHLDEPHAIAAMREMDRVARQGVIISDLLRDRRAYAWISIFTLLSSPLIRHDAKASVAQAFTAAEIQQLRDTAGLAYAVYHRHFAHRFVLAGEK